MRVTVTRHHLEILRREDLKPSRGGAPEGFELKQARIPCPELNRFLYNAVGAYWVWIDRLAWTRSRWLDYLTRSGVETWVAYLDGTPAGYFELDPQAEGSVEIAYFGVLAQFTGRGVGSHLLACAVERAFDLGARRVWLHTCSLDHPQALNNYRARGFCVFKVETFEQDIPDSPPSEWQAGGSP